MRLEYWVHNLTAVADHPPAAIAIALVAALEAHGLTVADLARDLNWPPPTLYNIVGGRVTMIRSRALRDALDRYFEVAPGTTLRICRQPPGSSDIGYF